ncbi:MAG: hypothetical protein ACT4PM_02000 [Gemmatimonadales bacterium]
MRYSYALQVIRDDGTEVRQVPVQPDWEPAREWVRLKALERGQPPEEAFLLECAVRPRWDPDRGQPFLGGFDAGPPNGALPEVFASGYFGELARDVTKRLVAEGVLEKGDLVRCLLLAFAEQPETTLADAPRLGRPAPPRIRVRPGSLGDAGASPAAGETMPVLIPERVLAETAELTLAEQAARETGGILIGHLCRDGDAARLFVHVTAQIPARHTEATRAKLTFTPATWTDVQAALTLRGREEIMLGWWHSHPVREWCKECPPEKRKVCVLGRGFLSEDDRLLHRTVFPRAFSVALVVNDVEGGPTWSLFGWNRGVIEARDFHRQLEREETHAAAG